jgi:transcriptional regulator with XRE-family HTH domain
MKQQKLSDLRKTPTTLGDTLRQHREDLGLSLTEMAARLGVSGSHLSRLERNKIEHPAPDLLLQISKCMAIDAQDLYALTGLFVPDDLPELVPYLRAKHPDWPELAVTQLDTYCDFLKARYSLH